MAEEKTVANLSEEKVEEVKEEANIMETIVHVMKMLKSLH